MKDIIAEAQKARFTMEEGISGEKYCASLITRPRNYFLYVALIWEK